MEFEKNINMSLRFFYLNVMLMAAGSCGSPLIIHLYFLYGGKSVWLSTWLQTAGFPIILLPLLIISCFQRLRIMKTENSQSQSPNNYNLIAIDFPLLISSSILGLIVGLTNYTFAFGFGHLPASTALLISSLQLAFLSIFAFIVVRRDFNCYSFIAVVLLAAGGACLSAVSWSDKLPKESDKMYYLGLALTIAYAVLSGLLYPLIELAYKKLGREEMRYRVIMESQVVVAFFATVVSTIAMLIQHDFKVHYQLFLNI